MSESKETIRWPCVSPLNPHDASNHHFVSWKAQLITPKVFKTEILMKPLK